MHSTIDDDEWETVFHSRPCSSCGGNLRKCDGRCNGSFGISSRRRDSSAVKVIKAARGLAREDAILAEAADIRARRGM